MQKHLLLALLFVASQQLLAQPRSDKFLTDLFSKNTDSIFQKVISNPGEYHYQIVYTQINRDKNNVPSFTNYYCNYDSLQYFNPASTVKMPLAFLSLEKIHTLKKYGVTKNTSMEYDSSYSKQSRLYTDSTSETGKPSIAHFIKKAFLISDNDAYTRMYEFVGQQTINKRLHEMGYGDIRITRRFVRMNEDENRHTNPVRFLDENGKVLYSQPAAYNTDSIDFSHINKMGSKYINANDSLINEPIDFTTANNLSVFDLQQLLQSVLFPKSVPAKQRFQLTDEDYAFLYRYLSQYPSETDFPKYDSTVFYNSYVKFYFQDSTHTMPSNIRVFNKVGWAYGCLTDVSYIVDFTNNVEFMLTSTIYVNSDGIMNDDKYEYESIGLPFLYSLGQFMYRYELSRKRKYKPNLENFQLPYKAQKNDGRLPVSSADN